MTETMWNSFYAENLTAALKQAGFKITSSDDLYKKGIDIEESYDISYNGTPSTFEINLWFHPSYESYYANIRIYGGHTLIEYGSEGPLLIDFVEALIKIIDREKDSKYWPNYNKLKQAKPKLQEIVDKFYSAI